MAKKFTKTFKRVVNGYIPYWLTRFFRPSSPCIPYYKAIIEHGDDHFILPFRHEYESLTPEVLLDTDCGLPYVVLDARYGCKRLYFRRGSTEQQVWSLYLTLLAEQDARSPHHYLDSTEELKGRTLLDVGCAEGILSLMCIEQVSHVYLFECEEAWIEALGKTFEPWKEKVTIVRKYVGATDDDHQLRLDTFFADKPHKDLFLKMDIEGMERHALAGADRLLSERGSMAFAVCTYHLPDDVPVITGILDRYHCQYIGQKGYYRHHYRTMLLRGHN